MYFLHTSSHLFLQGCSVKRDSLAFFNATNNSLSFFPALQISAAPIMPKSLHFFAVFMSKIFLISESPSHYCAQQELKNVLSRNYSNFQKKSSKFFFFFYKTLLTTMCWFWPIPVTINSAYGNLSIRLLCQLLRCCQSKWPVYWDTKHNIVLGSPIWWTPGPAWRSSKGEPIQMAKQLWCWTVTFKLLPGWQELTYRLGQCLPLDLHLPLKKSFFLLSLGSTPTTYHNCFAATLS